MIVEYRPSVEGLKNIYSKLLTLGGTIDIPEGETKGMAQYIVDYFEYIYGL